MEFLNDGRGRTVLSAGNGHPRPLSRVQKAFGHRETKDCRVVLNRLDEKLLKRYLRRRKDSKRKRRKVKPLCYTDDDDDSVEAKPLKNCFLLLENDESAQVASQEMKDTKEESKEMGCELVGMVEQTEKELTVESSGSLSGGAEYCSVVDNDVEISKEFPRSFPGNVTCDKAICDEKFIAQDDSVNDLDYSRDDSEDDRSTVIFEKDTYLEEVFEIEEKEMRNNLKKKKITNRKKQRLVKFKRKSMNGRNLGKIRKSKSRLFESGSGGLGLAEKGVSDCIPEDSLREVCISVRRLHEMYTIILQLQKEMPKDTELSYHFKRVINAQRENFHREIRKSQKIIIKSFEKMLKPSNNTLDKVALDIGNRTFLTSEDVIYVLSLCILSEGSYGTEKNRSGSMEKTEQPKSSSSSLRKPIITKKAAQAKSYKPEVQHKEVVNTEVPSMAPASRTSTPSFIISDHPVEPQSQAPVAFVPNSRAQISRACPQSFSYHQLEKSYQRSHFWAQQNYESGQINNSGVRQYREVNLPQVVSQSAPSTHLPSTMSQYYNVPYTNQNVLYPAGPRPPSNSIFCPSLGHYQRGGNLPPVQGQISGPPIRLPSQGQYNYIPDKPNANQTFDSPVLMQNTVGYGAVPNRISESDQPVTMASITQERGSLPNLENLSCNIGNGEIIPSPESSSQCHLNLTHSVGFYNSASEKPVHERRAVPAEAGTETSSTVETNSEVSEVLDPTIPQRLTMKDSRLQAGPILDSDQSSEEKKTKSNAVENPNQEHSRSRTYICAEDGCKNPGVRICNFCRSVIYCSKTCQRKHWDLKHKDECCQLKELRG